MLQETVDELWCSQGATFFGSGLGVAITKGDAVSFYLQNTVVANGHPENVRGQILQSTQARADTFTVHDPLLLPDGWRDACITIRATQGLLDCP